jgi:hypothetical protein
MRRPQDVMNAKSPRVNGDRLWSRPSRHPADWRREHHRNPTRFAQYRPGSLALYCGPAASAGRSLSLVAPGGRSIGHRGLAASRTQRVDSLRLGSGRRRVRRRLHRRRTCSDGGVAMHRNGNGQRRWARFSQHCSGRSDRDDLCPLRWGFKPQRSRERAAVGFGGRCERVAACDDVSGFGGKPFMRSRGTAPGSRPR